MIVRDLKGRFIKDAIPWNKGLKNWRKGYKHSEETKRKIKQNHINVKERNNPRWKGNNAGRRPLHQWIERHWGKANHCELCGKNGDGKGNKFEWANLKNHKYSRDINDYIMLCNSCHQRMDKGFIEIETPQKLRKGIVYPKT